MASLPLASNHDQRLADLLAQRAAARAMDRKTVAADAIVEATGEFTALIASFDTVDRVGDVIRRGAFEGSLARWRQRGRRIPVAWSHEVRDPALLIGSADPRDAREIAEGLVVKGRLNIDRSAAADHVYSLLRNGDVDSWSFGYRVIRQRRVDSKRTELLELELLEFGPTATPANAEARTLTVKGCEPRRREPPPVPTAAAQHRRFGQLTLDLLLDGVHMEPTREAPPPGPTDEQLCERAEAAGVALPQRKADRIRADAREQMLALLGSSDA